MDTRKDAHKGIVVATRFGEDEAAEIQRRAEAQGIKPYEWLRNAGRAALERERDEREPAGAGAS